MALIQNHYTCPICGGNWLDHWDSAVDDDCPHCGKRNVSPHESAEINPDWEFDE